MFALFSETATGLVFIRAYKAHARFVRLFEDLQNENIAAFWFSMTANRWYDYPAPIISPFLTAQRLGSQSDSK